MKISIIPIMVILSLIFTVAKNIFGKKQNFTYDEQWKNEGNTFVNKQDNLDLDNKVQFNEFDDRDYEEDLTYENEQANEDMVKYQEVIDDEEMEIQQYLEENRKEQYKKENKEIVDVIKDTEINDNKSNYNFDRDDLIKGIVMSEILSKPKSLRK